jgi:hypothetical protein
MTWRWLKHRPTEPTPYPDQPREPDLTPPIVSFEANMGTSKAALSSDRERVTGHELQLELRPVVLGSRVLIDERFFGELP